MRNQAQKVTTRPNLVTKQQSKGSSPSRQTPKLSAPPRISWNVSLVASPSSLGFREMIRQFSLCSWAFRMKYCCATVASSYGSLLAPSSCICSDTGTRSWAGHSRQSLSSTEQRDHPPWVWTCSLVTLAPLAAALTLTLKSTKTPMSMLSTYSIPQLCLYHTGLRRLDLF